MKIYLLNCKVLVTLGREKYKIIVPHNIAILSDHTPAQGISFSVIKSVNTMINTVVYFIKLSFLHNKAKIKRNISYPL